MAVSSKARLDEKTNAKVEWAIAYADAHHATDQRAYLNRLWANCAEDQTDALLLAGQWCVETAVGSPQNPRWATNHNPAGLAIVASGDPDPGAWTPEQAADIHAATILIALRKDPKKALARSGLSAPGAAAFIARWQKKYADPACPIVKTIGDLDAHYLNAAKEPSATWAWDKTYGDQIAAHVNGILAYQHTPAPAPTPAPTPKPAAWTPIVVDQAITPWTNANRDGGKLDLTRGTLHITVHGTGNPNPGADRVMHGRWQASADAVRAMASVHGYIDDTGFTQTLPLDEIAYHAGDGCNDIVADVGCFRGVAFEICEASTVDHAKANDVAAQVFSMVVNGDPRLDWGSGATKGKFDYDHFDQHIWVSQENPPHDCPNRIRHLDDTPWSWDYLMTRIDFWAPIVAAALAPPSAPPPSPAPTPKPTPSDQPVPGIPLPAGITVPWLKQRWAGNATGRITIRGKVSEWSPNGVFSRAWLRKCLATIPAGKGYEDGVFPAVKDFVPRTDGVKGDEATFENGWTIVSRPPTGGKGQ